MFLCCRMWKEVFEFPLAPFLARAFPEGLFLADHPRPSVSLGLAPEAHGILFIQHMLPHTKPLAILTVAIWLKCGMRFVMSFSGLTQLLMRQGGKMTSQHSRTKVLLKKANSLTDVRIKIVIFSKR